MNTSRILKKSLFASGFSLMLGAGTVIAAVQVDQQPLLTAQPVPGNMAIVGSFEFPTMVSKANNGTTGSTDTSYVQNGDYVGYFDSRKCYEYVYSAIESERHFKPVNWNGANCGGSYWSGHFMNWAATQAIDVFRSVLTGGYRVKDEVGNTWLEKGVQTGQGGNTNFPEGHINNNSTLIRRVTPTSYSTLKTRVLHLGNKMRFTATGTFPAAGDTVVAYDPAVHKVTGSGGSQTTTFDASTVYELSVRVKVCVPNLLEENCVRYSATNFKPEGLVQENALTMRYSKFGYAGDGAGSYNDYNGVAMRARMKYVGPQRVNDQGDLEPNPNREWDSATGIFVKNPDPADASASVGTVAHSGVINAINLAGQIVPNARFKTYDTVSELYYLTYRYFKKLSAPSNFSGIASASNIDVLADGLPMISNWYPSTGANTDSMQFSCQKNFVLGIGDTNTHYDRNVPGGSGIGFNASVVPGGDNVNVDTELARIIALEKREPGSGSFELAGALTTSHRSAYIAALAFNANTNDLRPEDDWPGKQTVSTYWIDILEYGRLKGRSANQYWLAAKYGGFRAPEDYDPADTSKALDRAWWYTNGQTLTPNDIDTASMPRPDNFYTVNRAADLRDSLRQAFSDIQKEQLGSRSTLAVNSAALEQGSAVFQSVYTSGSWTGDIKAFTANPSTGELSTTAAWSAESKLPVHGSRNIKVNSNGLKDFKYNQLTNAHKLLVNSSSDVVEYLRGDRSMEGAGGFRIRQGLLGDFVNSSPIFVGAPNPRLFSGRSFAGSTVYPSWATTNANRTPVLYVGGNDGMLHGFNATVGATSSGVETLAFIPKTVLENGIKELADPAYQHRYFVDGELTVADAWNGSAWRTVLVGTLGAGGVKDDRSTTNNAVFALDVTNPGSPTLLWEKSTTDISQLGVTLGRPVIAQIADGNWKVLLGNGVNSPTDRAALLMIDVFSGAVQATQLSTDSANGLSGVRAWDSNSDGITDTVYAGDLRGKLWKVTNLAGTPVIQKLFTAQSPSGAEQPITATPLVGRSRYSQELFVFFGTGQFIGAPDLNNKSLQTWYAVSDVGTVDLDRGNLLERKILADMLVSGQNVRIIEEGSQQDIVDAGKLGWFIDLYQVSGAGNRQAIGERMVVANQFRGTVLVGTSRIPDASDPCEPTGRSVIMAIDPFTGARLDDSFFDLNRDKKFDDLDMVSFGGQLVVVSGIGLGAGASNPSFIGDRMYIPMDDGNIMSLETQIPPSRPGRTSWRELINFGD